MRSRVLVIATFAKAMRKKIMRQYLIHRKYYIAYQMAQRTAESILDEHEKLLQKVLPKSPLAEHEREFMASSPVGGSGITRKAEDYAIEVEQHKIRERLISATDALQTRKLLLAMNEEELRKSKDIYNVIYVAKWIDGMKVGDIARDTGYSRSQIYSIIKHLKAQLERNHYD